MNIEELCYDVIDETMVLKNINIYDIYINNLMVNNMQNNNMQNKNIGNNTNNNLFDEIIEEICGFNV
jgi:hypothetical protein